MLKYARPEDFNDIDEIKRYVFDSIASFRFNKSRGIIAEFNRSSFDEYIFFARIGNGSLGGKARGLAFIDSVIKKHRMFDKYDNVIITIPRTIVLATDIFDEFMDINDLYKIGLSNLSDEEILNHFIKARLPYRIHEDLIAFISVAKNPIAIRSSSLLEDSHYQPFAGIYSTYMIPKVADERKMNENLSCAIKSVYASVFFKDSKAYMSATSNVIDEEKMAIVLQEVCGTNYGDKFYPTISGVARSINFYPIYPEKSEEGVVNIAFGLGKYIVDGGVTIRFSPHYPNKIIQLSSPQMAIKETQKSFFALDMDPNHFVPSTDDGVNIVKVPIKDAEKDNTLKFVASSYDAESNILRDGVTYEGRKVITFGNILSYNTFPLADIIKSLLEIGQKEMNTPVEIEFAINLDRKKGESKIFNFLQIRPIVDNKETITTDLEKVNKEEAIVYSTSALGNGVINDLHDLIYIKPSSFDSSKTAEIALIIEKINTQFLKEGNSYILIGPGRWGSSDPWLGIPVKWPQISAARLIIESGLENYRVDPSQGTHFFQNLTSFRVGYFTINPYINDGHYDLDYLNSFEPFFEDEYIRHIKFPHPLVVKIDGKKNIGVIYKMKN
jgi:hypothetical protein